MLRQIQQKQNSMRISVQLHMGQKNNVFVNSENIVIPQQLLTSIIRLDLYRQNIRYVSP